MTPSQRCERISYEASHWSGRRRLLAVSLGTLRQPSSWDLGARVIKIERPGTGDLCRQLYISNLSLDGDSTLFHSINRNKQSYAADLKNPDDLACVRKLLMHAD